ncbi:MAG TPA: phosphatase PAP2 family protein [Gaiellaceae bacterium]|nr:phosphatase PAP2 family protein [Gaiellaceae bacterium]
MSGPSLRIQAAPAIAVGREAGLIAAAALLYFGVRGFTEDRFDRAFANADALLRLERDLGIDWEHRLQELVIDHRWLVAATNWVYVYGHWPVIVACGIALYLRSRDRYRLLRNAMFISGLIGFVFFAALPMAPPRLADPAVVDTVTEYSRGYRALQPPALTNQYAAFPSLHAGWNILLGIVIFQATTRLSLRVFAVVMPAAMAFAVVATANHYVLDVVAGTVVVLAGLLVATRITAPTLSGGERPRIRTNRSARSPIRRRASVRELPDRPAVGRGARCGSDRGRRAPLSGAPRGAPPQDAGPGPDPVGPVEARKPVRPPAARS